MLIKIYIETIEDQKNTFGKNKMNRLFFLVCILLFPHFTNLYAIENKIEFKVNNEIITTIDIIKELNFLAALNPKILDLDKNQIFEISKNSIIKEKKIIKIRYVIILICIYSFVVDC